MDPHDIQRKRVDYRHEREAALSITDKAAAEDRQLTDAEVKALGEHVKAAKQLHNELESTALGADPDVLKTLTELSRRPELQLDRDGLAMGVKAGDAPGTREQHAWTKALLEGSREGAFGQKGISGGGQGTVVVGSLADPAARLGAPGGELLALLSVEEWGGRGGGSSVEFLREATRDLNAALVAVSAAKPSSDIGLDMVTADTWTFAHFIGGVPLQWLTDAANLDTLISSELAYGVQLAVEGGIVNGPGPLPGAPLGILTDPAVQQVPAAADAPLSVLDGLTAISSAGYATGAVCLNPLDWSAILGMRDKNDRPIYGGSPFQGPSRSLWSSPVVLSNAIPSGTAIVGDVGSAVRMVEREPVQVIVGTVDAELTHNQRTFVGEVRSAFAVVRPEALAVVDLGAGVGTLSAQAQSAGTSSSSGSSKKGSSS